MITSIHLSSRKITNYFLKLNTFLLTFNFFCCNSLALNVFSFLSGFSFYVLVRVFSWFHRLSSLLLCFSFAVLTPSCSLPRF